MIYSLYIFLYITYLFKALRNFINISMKKKKKTFTLFFTNIFRRKIQYQSPYDIIFINVYSNNYCVGIVVQINII